MNMKLIVAAVATLGLAACGPDVTPPASTAKAPTASSAPAQQPTEVAKAETPAAAPAAAEEKKEGAAPAAAEEKKEEGEKKAQ